MAREPRAGTVEHRLQRIYEDEVGDDALERQRELFATRFPCCGELRESGHHHACAHYVEDELPRVSEGQASLL